MREFCSAVAAVSKECVERRAFRQGDGEVSWNCSTLPLSHWLMHMVVQEAGLSRRGTLQLSTNRVASEPDAVRRQIEAPCMIHAKCPEKPQLEGRRNHDDTR